MDKKTPMRMIFNIILSALSVISIAAVGFISWGEYRNSKIPEVYTNKQIMKHVISNLSAEGFTPEDVQDISINKSDDNKSFSATVNLAKETELCKELYSAKVTFHVVDGKWKSKKMSKSLTHRNTEWLLDGTVWSAVTADGLEYRVSFLSETSVTVNISESENEVNINSDDASVYIEEQNEEEMDKYIGDQRLHENESDKGLDLLKDEYCGLVQEGEAYIGNLERPDGTSLVLIVTTNDVKIDLGDEKGEIILKKE